MDLNYKHIDLKYLKEISSNINFILKMFGIFKQELPKIEKNMYDAIKNEDYNSLGKVAHKAKSSVSVLGMNKDAEEMLKLEYDIKNKLRPDTYKSRAITFLKNSYEALKEINEISEQLKLNPDIEN